MRTVSLLSILVIIGLLAFPGFPDCRADPPEPLPDLYINAGEVVFLFHDYPVRELFNVTYDMAARGWNLTINVTVRNAGPGESASGNVSFYDNGSLLGAVVVNGTLSASGPGAFSFVEFVWNTNGVTLGNHTIRIEANDSTGDANPGNNTAERVVAIYGEPPVLSLRLDTVQREAVVSPTENGTVRFKGDAHVDGEPGQTFTVDLECGTDEGWATSISPARMVLGPSEQDLRFNFTVTVVVPAATFAITIASLSVDGRVEADGLESLANTKGIVYVRPYFGVVLESDRPGRELPPGQGAVFEARVQNTGNSIDSFSLEIANKKDLVAKGWKFTLSRTTLSKVLPNEYRNVTVSIEPPPDWAPWKSETTVVELKAVSLGAPSLETNATVTFSFHLTQKGFYLPGVILVTIVVILVTGVVAGALFLRRRRRRKTASDFRMELGLEGRTETGP